ncbi:hypothetical protein ACHAXS_008183 [Conticribra weissflogii]
MGVSASSTSRQTQRNNEQAYVRSLGDRYPLGDAELRKWIWCHDRLQSNGTPSLVPIQNSSELTSLAVWSASYGDYNPFSRGQSQPSVNSFFDRINSAKRVLETITIVENEILPAGLSLRIANGALALNRLSSKRNSSNLTWNPPDSSSTEEITAAEEKYYSISSYVNKFMSAGGKASYGHNDFSGYTLEQFLEGLSVSCGRRGSRACLSKFFAIVAAGNGGVTQQTMAKASDIIFTAYSLTLAASFMKHMAYLEDGKSGKIDWRSFIPEKDPKGMSSMVDSLLNHAKTRRKEYGPNSHFDYPSTSATSSSASKGNETSVSLQEFLDWSETMAPMMGSALSTFLHVLFTYFSNADSPETDSTKGPRFPPGVTPIFIPNLTIEKAPSTAKYAASTPTSSFFHEPHWSSFDLFALTCTSLSLASGRWHRLFSSEANGLSCNRLMHSILGYGGPTLLLIRSKDSRKDGKCGTGVFGAFTYTPWDQESGSFYGNSDCFLFRLGPDAMCVYRPKGGGDNAAEGLYKASKSESNNSRNFMYFNPEARSKGFDGLAHGIGFGGTAEAPRLFIDEVLDGCRASTDDLTFDNGPLLSGVDASNSNQFDVESIEVWGVGTSSQIDEALLARDEQREDAAKKIRQAMKGAKGQFLEDFQSGLAGSKLFQHRQEMRGRDGGCDLDQDNDERTE